MNRLFLITALFAAGSSAANSSTKIESSTGLLAGRFDNRAQVEEAAASPTPVPHVEITIVPTPRPNWQLWRVHVETDPQTSYDQTWAMEARKEYDGSGSLIPYYELKQGAEPSAVTFNPEDWLSLEACALRGAFTEARVEGFSEGEPCVAVTMSIGARRALLPVGFVREGRWLHLDLNLRGVRTRIDAAAADPRS